MLYRQDTTPAIFFPDLFSFFCEACVTVVSYFRNAPPHSFLCKLLSARAARRCPTSKGIKFSSNHERLHSVRGNLGKLPKVCHILHSDCLGGDIPISHPHPEQVPEVSELLQLASVLGFKGFETNATWQPLMPFGFHRFRN